TSGGQSAEVLINAALLTGAGSEILGCVIVLVDVTERKRIEDSLRASNERFRLLSESNIIGIVSANTEGIYESNDLFLGILGYTREELERGIIRWKDITPPESLAVSDRDLEELFATGACRPFEKEFLRKDGTRLPVLMGATLLKRDPASWIGFILDLTERKKLERKLFEKQKLESIGLLAGGIAHDFNNLLVGILGNASLAQEMLPESSGAAHALDSIVKCSQQAAHLTRQMLAYSGKGQFVVEAVNLPEVVQQTIPLLHSSIPGGVDVRLDLDRNVPAVEADASQMHQVVMNLVLNAAEAIGEERGVMIVRTGRRYLDRGEIHHELDDALIDPGEYVFLEVRDSGCGMDEATKARIFDPFFTTKFTGRGLGLAAVAGIVRGHKGAIRVVSSPGHGSSFTVYFPAAPAPVRQVPAEPTRPLAEEKLRGAGTVLVVDDEEVVVQTARLALERHGYTVLSASSGKVAIEILQRERGRISLVLLDASMPVMSGRETLAELLKIDPNLEVLVSSGYAEVETMRLFTGQRVSGFVQKPYTPARLAKKVIGALSGSGGTGAGPRA
ncbi:MAG: response regulator, partial [Acidobacteriia bacterium]|nr:response regulator [Terriglobia bacterium]